MRGKWQGTIRIEMSGGQDEDVGDGRRGQGERRSRKVGTIFESRM